MKNNKLSALLLIMSMLDPGLKPGPQDFAPPPEDLLTSLRKQEERDRKKRK